MIKKETVLILGAGASKPYGLPTGRELRDEVINLSGHPSLGFYAGLVGFDAKDYAVFARELAISGFSSVDAYLEQHENWLDIGKLALAINLLSFEFKSRRRLFPPYQPKDHWHEVLWSKLTAPSWKSFKRNPISVITFNYDRIFEHYLANVLSYTYGIRLTTAAQGLASLPIVHVHGSLGPYLGAVSIAEFATGVEARDINIARNSIRIVHEGDEATGEFKAARKLIKNAERVLFLGFGYHEVNMKKLGLSPESRDTERSVSMFGTHKGFKRLSWSRIQNSYGFESIPSDISSGTISDFIAELVY